MQDERRKLIGDLLGYAERFAQANNEPAGGHCQETIRKAQAWHETGSATIDPVAITSDLIGYVERFAKAHGEPAQGECQQLLVRARSLAAPGAEPGGLKVFEVTAAGFDGGSDETDDHVFWVTAQSAEVVQAAIAFTGATFCDELPADCMGDADFELPRQAMGLSSALLEKASDFRNRNRPVA